MSNEEMGAPALLRAAARLVEKATLQLDMREHACTGCGRRAAENLVHWKVNEMLRDMPGKLRNAALQLEGKMPLRNRTPYEHENEARS